MGGGGWAGGRHGMHTCVIIGVLVLRAWQVLQILLQPYVPSTQGGAAGDTLLNKTKFSQLKGEGLGPGLA